MILLGLLFWLIVPLISHDAFYATVIDLPLIAILLANKRIVAARWASLLCIWNMPYIPEASLFWIAACRLFAIEGCYFFMQNMLTEQLPRALIASVLLPAFVLLFSSILVAATTQDWTWKLYVGFLLLSFGLTLLLFSVRASYSFFIRKRT